MTDFEFKLTTLSMMKAQQWEIAKGALRAMAAMQGAYHSADSNAQTDKWKECSRSVEKFISDFEDEGLCE